MHQSMKIILLLVALTSLSRNAGAESPPADFLTEFNTDRIELNTWAMVVLAGWAVGNIAVGTVGNFTSSGSSKYLHQGNAAWNVVNLAIAGFALYGLMGEDAASLNAAETLEKAHDMEWLLWLNSGLDLAYIAAGGFLWERGLRKDGQRLVGYGRALIIQGGFLLLFDLTLVALNMRLNQDLVPQLLVSSSELGTRVASLAWRW